MKKILSILFLSSAFICRGQIINTIAGTGVQSNTGDGASALNASVYIPVGGCFDRNGNYYFATGAGETIRKISPNGIIHTIAGTGTSGFSGDNGPALNAQLRQPVAVAVDSIGNVYIADAQNNRIRKIDISTGIISTIAGTGVAGYGGDGGQAINAILNGPASICFDRKGNLYIADYPNSRVRKIDPTGIIRTYAGTGIAGYNGDGRADTSQLYSPFGLCSDDTGDVYIADIHGRIRKIDTFGYIHTIAGIDHPGYSGDNGPAINAAVSSEYLTVDKEGNIYTTEGNSSRVRKINVVGIITTIAGDGSFAFNGDGGLATSAKVFIPEGVTIDSCGNIIICDSYNYRIRKISFNPTCSPEEVKTISSINDVSIYPNPAREQLTITGSGIKGIRVLNAIGQVLIEQISYSDKAIVNVQGLQSGVYFVRLSDKNGGVLTKRFVKE